MIVNNDFFKKLLDNLYDAVYFVDRDRRITYWNIGAEMLTGYKGSEVVGTYCRDNILMHVDDEGNNLCVSKSCPAVKAMTEGRTCEEELYLHHKDGYRVPILTRVTPIRDLNGQIVGAVEIFNDNSSKITTREEIEELQKMALLDPLTKLGNRRYAEINLHARLDETHRYGWSFGVLFFDIDYFKKLNDVYGHDIGDKVLKMVARTSLNSVRSFDIVSRWGGDEFIGIVVNVDEDQLYSVANRLCVLVQQSSFSVESGIIQVTISVGATLAQPNDTVDTLLKRADQLMYHSKTSGGSRVSMGFDM